jgi:exonuclease VII large subunit
MKRIKQFEKETTKKLNQFDEKIKTSFTLIRQDVDEMQVTIDAMRKYLKKKDKQYEKEKEKDKKIQDEFQKDIDEFTQKISQLKLALSAVRDLKEEVITRKELAQIEDRIKTSFKSEVENYKEQVKKLRLYLKESEKRITALESGKVFEKKKGWFFKRKEDEDNNP